MAQQMTLCPNSSKLTVHLQSLFPLVPFSMLLFIFTSYTTNSVVVLALAICQNILGNRVAPQALVHTKEFSASRYRKLIYISSSLLTKPVKQSQCSILPLEPSSAYPVQRMVGRSGKLSALAAAYSQRPQSGSPVD